MVNIKVSELPSTDAVNDNDYLMVIQNNASRKAKMQDTVKTKVLWSGDLIPTAIDTDIGDNFATSDLRPYNYKFCYAKFSIDGTYYLLPFEPNGYGVSATYCGFWCIDSSTNAYLRFYYGGYGSFNFRVKQINNKTINQVHLYEIVGIK